MFTNKKR